jgi:hypothetical protein
MAQPQERKIEMAQNNQNALGMGYPFNKVSCINPQA